MAYPIDAQLLTAANFAVLGASTVTNTGPTVITGANLGLYPGTSVTGFPPGVVTPPATQQVANATANLAQVQANNAFNYYSNLPNPKVLSGGLDGQTYFPGVYSNASSVILNVGQTVTLDAQGNTGATFVFITGSTLTIGNSATVLLINGAQAYNVIWVVGSSATIGTAATMVGDVVAKASVTLTTGASLIGRAIGLTGAVTMDTNRITAPAQQTGSSGGVGGSGLSLLSVLEYKYPVGVDNTQRHEWIRGTFVLTSGSYPPGGYPINWSLLQAIKSIPFGRSTPNSTDVPFPINVEVKSTSNPPSGFVYIWDNVLGNLHIFITANGVSNNSGPLIEFGGQLTPAMLTDNIFFRAIFNREN